MSSHARFGAMIGAATLAGLFAVQDALAQSILRIAPDEVLSNATGLGGDAINPSLSDDGRFVVFEQENELFIVDRQTGSLPSRIIDCSGGSPPDFCLQPPSESRPRISGDGRFVVFSTFRPIAEDPFGFPDSDVYRWERLTGQITMVSRSQAGVEGNADSEQPDVSRDGRYVAFQSRASNLIDGGPTPAFRTRVFRKDMITGLVQIMPDSAFVEPQDLQQFFPRISADGQRVLANRFLSFNEGLRIWLVGSSTILNAGPNVHPAARGQGQFGPADIFTLSSDGRFSLTLESGVGRVQPARYHQFGGSGAQRYADPGYLLGGDGPNWGLSQDLTSGGGFLATHSCFFGTGGTILAHVNIIGLRASRNVTVRLGALGTLEACERGLDITPNGRFLVASTFDLSPDAAFFSPGAFPDDTDGANDIILIENPLWNPTPTNVAQAAGVPAGSRNVQVSADGKKTVFESDIPASSFNGLYVDNNAAPDVFEYDAESGEVTLLSSLDGVNAFPAGASKPTMSQDGRNVVFEATDSGVSVPNLGGATPVSYGSSHRSVFLRNQLTGTRRVSAPSVGGAPDGSSMNPSISPNGRFIVFGTDASNVNPTPDSNGRRDVVRVDVETGGRDCISQCPGVQSDGDSDQPSVSNQGDVAWSSDSQALQRKAGLAKGISVRQIFLRNQLTGRSQVVTQSGAGQPGNAPSERPRLSGNGRTLVYESGASNLPGSATDGRRHVYWYQLSGNQNRRLSRREDPGGKQVALSGDSGEPQVSADGRFIAFQSAAGDLDPLDTNGVTDLFVFDTRTDRLVRLSEGFGGAEPNGSSQTPHLNRNGTRIGFQSLASNFDETGEGGAPLGFAAPLLHVNPSARDVVFADAFD